MPSAVLPPFHFVMGWRDGQFLCFFCFDHKKQKNITQSINIISRLLRFPARSNIRTGAIPAPIEIWLILPVVICLFQGLSHANVRVLVLRHRGVCVRLIKRFMVYPTKEGLVPFLRDNCANRAANTWKNIP